MDPKKLLKGKRLLIVDDEKDVLNLLIELLDMCKIDSAASFEEAKDLFETEYYDLAILDIMGVNGFELLKTAVSREFPTVMLTAHALSPESLKKSIKLGAVSFLPKEKISELSSFLEDARRSAAVADREIKSLETQLAEAEKELAVKVATATGDLVQLQDMCDDLDREIATLCRERDALYLA